MRMGRICNIGRRSWGERREVGGWSRGAQLTEARLREHDGDEARIEHQPSLRSLLSATSPIDSQDVQQEILHSIIADGLLEGVDIDNLTTEQEEELTERIADAYRRRQRRRERTRNHERREASNIRPSTAGAEPTTRHHARTISASAQQPRIRPPVSRPHLFEQTNLDPASHHGRSPSSTSQRSNRSGSRPNAAPASRSATDLSERPVTEETARARQRRMSNNARSFTDPSRDENMRTHISRVRASSGTNRSVQSEVFHRNSHPLEAVRRRGGSANNSSPSLPISGTAAEGTPVNQQQSVRPATSTAAFAPEPISNATLVPEPLHPSHGNQSAPSLACSRCEKLGIQHNLHYHCPWCRSGSFNLCLACYRAGQGCDHWFGFGYQAYERWRRLAPPEGWPNNYERPHTLVPRRWIRAEGDGAPGAQLQEGAFCEGCLNWANECYWYCYLCLSGAWGYCNSCVQQGRCCTHPLLPVAHLNSLRQRHQDPAKAIVIQMPHHRPDSYVALPIMTDCDICHRAISPRDTRFHCSQCSNGDYDVCTECYYSLVATGKISAANSPNSWRRCLQGHRMSVVGYQLMPEGAHQRVTVREVVGGRRHKDENPPAGVQPPPPPSDSSLGARCVALWSYFPAERVEDELPFPKNAEITEVEEVNADWSVGVYAGRVGLFPGNHVQRI